METKKGSFGKPFLSKRSVGIAIVLCSVLLVALPAIAAEDDFVLGVYGNANEDDTIDMRDLTYVKLIFFGEKQETELADAKYDGVINPLDFVQIKLMIVGKEKEITIVDSNDKVVTIDMPVERIAGLHTSANREFCKLGVEDKVVGVDKYILDDLDMYPGLEGKPNIGSIREPNYELIVKNKPDVMIGHTYAAFQPAFEKIESLGIKVVALPFVYSHRYNLELKQLGYILGKEERAAGYIEWKQGIIELIEDRTKDLEDEEKFRVFATGLSAALKGENDFYARSSSSDRIIELAGCRNLAAEAGLPARGAKVSGEWILENDPDVIILGSYYTKEGFGYSVAEETLAKQSLSQVLDHEVIGKTKAAKEGRVYIYGYYGTSSGGQKHLGALYLAKRLYPECFEDVNPEEFHRAYFEDWHNIPYRGVWFYP
jgi:iron complex transport system substrate-binding protein